MSNSRERLIKDQIKCSCKGRNLDKLVQPKILTILAQKNLHGYLIIQELENKKLVQEDKLDRTGIYRTLQTLEQRELVVSQWEIDGTGPSKKIYSITEAGKECLANWIETLEDYKRVIDTIIGEAKDVLK